MSSMYLTLFASGSSGNCALVSCGETHILVDAGISARRITTALKHWGLTGQDISACLITHPHTDHISGLKTLTRQLTFPLYATAPVARQLCAQLLLEHRVRPITPGESFSLGSVQILPIPTSHDTPGSVGFRFTALSGRSAAIVTDLGCVTPEVESGVQGTDVAVIECNHDLDCLHNGPYSYALQARVAGSRGHLCNEDGASLCALCARHGAHTLILGHLSQHNNSPSLALRAAETAVQQALGVGHGVAISVAPVCCEGVRFEV